MSNISSQLASNSYLHNNYQNFRYFYFRQGQENANSNLIRGIIMAQSFIDELLMSLQSTRVYLRSQQQQYLKSIDKDKKELLNKKEKTPEQILEEYLLNKRWSRSFFNNYNDLVAKRWDYATPAELAKLAFISTLVQARTINTKDVTMLTRSFIQWVQSAAAVDFTQWLSIRGKKLRQKSATSFHNFISENASEGLQDIAIDKIQEIITHGGKIGLIKTEVDVEIMEDGIIEQIFRIFSTQFKSFIASSKILTDKKGHETVLSDLHFNLRELFGNTIGNIAEVNIEELDVLGQMGIENYLLFYPIINYMQGNRISNLTVSNSGELRELMMRINQILSMAIVYKTTAGLVPQIHDGIQSSSSTLSSAIAKSPKNKQVLTDRYITDVILPLSLIVEELIKTISTVKRSFAKVGEFRIMGSIYDNKEMNQMGAEKKEISRWLSPAPISDWTYPNGLMGIGGSYGNVLADSITVEADIRFFVQNIKKTLGKLF